MLTAALTAVLYLICREALGWTIITSTAIAFVFGFGFRLTAQALGWEEWEPWEPAALKAGEKARKTLGEGLRAELESEHPSPKRS